MSTSTDRKPATLTMKVDRLDARLDAFGPGIVTAAYEECQVMTEAHAARAALASVKE